MGGAHFPSYHMACISTQPGPIIQVLSQSTPGQNSTETQRTYFQAAGNSASASSSAQHCFAISMTPSFPPITLPLLLLQHEDSYTESWRTNLEATVSAPKPGAIKPSGTQR